MACSICCRPSSSGCRKKREVPKFRTGSCGTDIAASTYRLRRYWGVLGPPNGSDSVKPADTLAPTITIRFHNDFVALVLARTEELAAGFGCSCARLVTAAVQLSANSGIKSH